MCHQQATRFQPDIQSLASSALLFPTPPWHFSASGQRPVSSPLADSYGPKILALRGTTVDTVLDVGTPWRPCLDSNFDYIAAYILFAEIKTFCARSWDLDPSKWPDTKTITDAIWKIPCAEQEANGVPRTRVSGAGLQGYCELINFLALMSTTQGALLQSAACQPYKIAMEYLHNRRPLLSVRGHVGLIPAHSMPGDVVCILYGAKVPFVLRKHDHRCYELVGDAYVFGIMDGEFLENVLK
jgi:hypothetical protein